MQKFELVIFDCDGVLVDSEPITNRVFGEMLHELGMNVTLDEADVGQMWGMWGQT